MRWLFEGLKGFILLTKDYALAYPHTTRGGFGILLLLTIAVAGLLAINAEKFWWARYVLIFFGFGILLLLFIGVVALGGELAGGSGAMGGRTGVMLSDLDAPPPEHPNKKHAPPVRRKGDAVPDWKVKPRAEAARALLDFLADADPAFAPERLVHRVEETAVAVRRAVEDGDLEPVAGRLTDHGRRELQAFLDGLAADGARQVYGKVTPTDVELVLVDAPADRDRHAVTALVTLKSHDYVADVRTGDIREGSPDELVVTHEFWSFRRDGKQWRLDRIRPAAEADELLDVLNELSAYRYREFQRMAPQAAVDQVTAVDF
jgi:predicted lipid-binding transport protein (Tim44 family)